MLAPSRFGASMLLGGSNAVQSSPTVPPPKLLDAKELSHLMGSSKGGHARFASPQSSSQVHGNIDYTSARQRPSASSDVDSFQKCKGSGEGKMLRKRRRSSASRQEASSHPAPGNLQGKLTLQQLDDALSAAHSMADALRSRVMERFCEVLGPGRTTCSVEEVMDVMREFGGLRSIETILSRSQLGAPGLVDYAKCVDFVAIEMRAEAMAGMLESSRLINRDDGGFKHLNAIPETQDCTSSLALKSNWQSETAPISGSITMHSEMGSVATVENSVQVLRRQLRMAEAGVLGMTRAVQADISWVHQNVKGEQTQRTRALCRRWGAEKMGEALNRAYSRIVRHSFERWWDSINHIVKREISCRYMKMKGVEGIFTCMQRWATRRRQMSWTCWTSEVRHQRFQEEDTAARHLQRMIRGFLGRRRVLYLQHVIAARIIQARVRGIVGRRRVRDLKEHLDRDAAARRLQAPARGMIARRELNRLKKRQREAAASLKVQSLCRGHVGRKEYSRRKEQKSKEDAAVRIQAIYKGHATRHAVRHDLNEKRKENRAAISIQTQWRRGLASKKVDCIREERRKSKAALAIQRAARRKAERVARAAAEQALLIQEREDAACSIQRLVRGAAARVEVQQLKLSRAQSAAAARIQAQSRGRRDRKRVQRLRSVNLEREARKAKLEQEARLAKERAAVTVARKRQESQERAAVRIQAMQRGKTARSRANARRFEKEEAAKLAEGDWRLEDESLQQEEQEELLEDASTPDAILLATESKEASQRSNDSLEATRAAIEKRKHIAAILIQKSYRDWQAGDPNKQQIPAAVEEQPLHPGGRDAQNVDNSHLEGTDQRSALLLPGGDPEQLSALQQHLSTLQEVQGRQQQETAQTVNLLLEQINELRQTAQVANDRLLEEHKEIMRAQALSYASDRERDVSQSASELQMIKKRLDEEENRVAEMLAARKAAEDELRHLQLELQRQKEEDRAELLFLLKQREDNFAASIAAAAAAAASASSAAADHDVQAEAESAGISEIAGQPPSSTLADAGTLQESLDAANQAYLEEVKKKLVSEYSSRWQEVQERLRQEEALAEAERQKNRAEAQAFKASLEEERSQLAQRLLEVQREMDELRQIKEDIKGRAVLGAEHEDMQQVSPLPVKGKATAVKEPPHPVAVESLASLLDAQSDCSDSDGEVENAPQAAAGATPMPALASDQTEKLQELERLLSDMRKKVQNLEEKDEALQSASLLLAVAGAASTSGKPESSAAMRPATSRNESPRPPSSRPASRPSSRPPSASPRRETSPRDQQKQNDGVSSAIVRDKDATTPEWIEYWDESAGASYFFNTLTQEASWTPPANLRITQPLSPSQPDQGTVSTPSELWTELWDASSGRPYWYNASRQEAVWEPPPGVQPLRSSAEGSTEGVNALTPLEKGPNFENPEEWVCYLDDASGEEYWFNCATGQVMWEHELEGGAAPACTKG